MLYFFTTKDTKVFTRDTKKILFFVFLVKIFVSFVVKEEEYARIVCAKTPLDFPARIPYPFPS